MTSFALTLRLQASSCWRSNYSETEIYDSNRFYPKPKASFNEIELDSIMFIQKLKQKICFH